MPAATGLRSAVDPVIAFQKVMYADPTLNAWFREGDAARGGQTLHDKQHGLEVERTACYLMRAVCRLRRVRGEEALTPLDKAIIQVTAFTHDVGSVIGPEDHHTVGAAMLDRYLGTEVALPAGSVQAISQYVARHRTSWVMSNGFDDLRHAIVVIADKCVGDESRVREDVRLELEQMKNEGTVRSYHDKHFLVNYAIKRSWLTADTPEDGGCASLTLQIELDTVVAEPEHVFGVFSGRYQAVHQAANYLGMMFRIEFSTEEGIQRFYFDEADRAWQQVEAYQLRTE